MKSSQCSSHILQGSHESLNYANCRNANLLCNVVVCHCGAKATLRKSKTTKSFGRQFWGCPNFKGPVNPGCGFFEWYLEEAEDKDGHCMQHMVEKLGNKFEDLQMDVVKVRLSIEEIRKETDQIQRQLKKMMKLEKCCSLMIVIMLLVMCFFKV
ncbi:uncharacterized protein LOC131615216 [Vicia villosa]|uniref:uncharacterized protein LOC131615216 n=1 Tax=Vicia villosa TaxID=3911 RepID=UPI00273C06EF|nr:uncharacterized protein LOC131615216 [Vicia villosa]